MEFLINRLSFSFFFSTNPYLPHTHTHTLSHTEASNSLSLSLSLSHTHTHTHTQRQATLSLSLSLTHTHSLSFSLFHSHTLSVSIWCCSVSVSPNRVAMKNQETGDEENNRPPPWLIALLGERFNEKCARARARTHSLTHTEGCSVSVSPNRVAMKNQETGDEENNRRPPWLKALLGETFYEKCKLHPRCHKRGCNMYCLDCMDGAFCPISIKHHHNDHRVVQVPFPLS